METVSVPATGTTRYSYDTVGNLKSVSYPNGTKAEYSYNALNRLVELTHTGSDGTMIASYAYTLDANGNRTRIEEFDGRTVDYVYDAAGKLLEERISSLDGDTSVTRYTYDAVGNRLSKTENDVTTNYQYDANNRLLQDGQITYQYDDNGNLTEKHGPEEDVLYRYNAENRLTRIDTTQYGVTIAVEYDYDAEGNRVKKVIDGNVEIRYLVDTNRPNAQVLEERDGDGNLLVRYVYGHDLISQTRDNLTNYYHYDGLGSTRALSSSAGIVTDEYTYDAFGNLLDKTGVTVNTHLYTGEFFDSHIGFYYLRARYMNPQVGRFVTMDSFAGWKRDPYSLHKYLYVHANPVNYIDPSGHMLSTAETTYVVAMIGAMTTWHLYNVTHPGDEWSLRECFIWTGWGAMIGGMGALWALPPDITPIANYVGAEVPKLSQVRALRDLGLSEVERRAFFEGKTVVFNIPTIGGDPTVATLRLSSGRLTAGIVDVLDESGAGLKAFTRFRAIARGLSHMFGVSELELQGVAVINSDIEAMLIRRGFTVSEALVPGELGGGTAEIYSKVFPVY